MQAENNTVSFQFALWTLLGIIGILTCGILGLKLDIVVVVL